MNNFSVIFSDQDLKDDSLWAPGNRRLFLAGPTPRSTEVKSWRPRAIEILRDEIKFEGTVLVPERRDWSVQFDYVDQVEWEFEGLHRCTPVFWVPRNKTDMLALTTNVEFGVQCGLHDNTGRPFIYGRPDDAANCRYLDWLYTKMVGSPIFNTLEDTLQAAADLYRRD